MIDIVSVVNDVSAVAIGSGLPFLPEPEILPPIENYKPTGGVFIKGNAIESEILSTQNTLNDADGLGTFNYQWLQNSIAISGATQATYTLSENDIGTEITVKVSYTDGLGKLEMVASNATDLIQPFSPLDFIVFEPTYNLTVDKMTVNEGEKVNFKLSTTNLAADTEVPFKFSGSISAADVLGGLKTTRFVVDVNGNATLPLQFLADKFMDGSTENLVLTLNSGESQSVAVKDTSLTPKTSNHKPSGNLVINGVLAENAVLTFANSITDEDGLGAFKYQWLRDNIAISKANQDNYVLTQMDIGKQISIKVSYTDKLGTSENVISDVTEIIKEFDDNKGYTKIATELSGDKLLGGEKNDNLTGNVGKDELLGKAGNDKLIGLGGNDTLIGESGNDDLNGGEGLDSLSGGSGNDLLDGGNGNDTLQGDQGNDTLKGGFGVDNMDGGDGDDYYFVDNSKDVVSESNKNGIGGNDTIESTSTYTLGKNIENLVLAGIDNNTGKGNELNNQITGNIGDNKLEGMAGNDKLLGKDGADTLDGGKGTDTLIGGNDDDIYIINNDFDTVIEEKNGGAQDQIRASVDYDLSRSPFVEVLTLSGAAVTGVGDEASNLLMEIDNGKVANHFVGYGGNDTILSEDGNDTIEGGAGDDSIDGGDGTQDIAIFYSKKENYQIKRNHDADVVDQITVKYVGNGDNGEIDEGKDILTNVELLQFADYNFNNPIHVDSILITGFLV